MVLGHVPVSLGSNEKDKEEKPGQRPWRSKSAMRAKSQAAGPVSPCLVGTFFQRILRSKSTTGFQTGKERNNKQESLSPRQNSYLSSISSRREANKGLSLHQSAYYVMEGPFWGEVSRSSWYRVASVKLSVLPDSPFLFPSL